MARCKSLGSRIPDLRYVPHEWQAAPLVYERGCYLRCHGSPRRPPLLHLSIHPCIPREAVHLGRLPSGGLHFETLRNLQQSPHLGFGLPEPPEESALKVRVGSGFACPLRGHL